MKTALEIIRESNVKIEYLKHLGILNDIEKLIIESSKMHVEASLTKAHNDLVLPKQYLKFTLSCYPLENIK